MKLKTLAPLDAETRQKVHRLAFLNSLGWVAKRAGINVQTVRAALRGKRVQLAKRSRLVRVAV